MRQFRRVNLLVSYVFHKGRNQEWQNPRLIRETRKPTTQDLEETEIAPINLEFGVKFLLITLQQQTRKISKPFRMSNTNKQE